MKKQPKKTAKKPAAPRKRKPKAAPVAAPPPPPVWEVEGEGEKDWLDRAIDKMVEWFTWRR